MGGAISQSALLGFTYWHPLFALLGFTYWHPLSDPIEAPALNEGGGAA